MIMFQPSAGDFQERRKMGSRDNSQEATDQKHRLALQRCLRGSNACSANEQTITTDEEIAESPLSARCYSAEYIVTTQGTRGIADFESGFVASGRVIQARQSV
jgi:hypothetical protein